LGFKGFRFYPLTLVIVGNVVWGFGWGFWSLIPLYGGEVGATPSLFGFVHGIGLLVSALSGFVGGVVSARSFRIAWSLVVFSYISAGLGLLLMILVPGALSFLVGYELYAANSVGWKRPASSGWDYAS
jgi:hypothetical protein